METERLVVAAQNQSIRTNLVKAKIDKSQKDTLRTLCKNANESINHAGSDYSKLAQKEYKRSHDKTIHWKLDKKCNFEAGDKWYEHERESVLESEIIKSCGISVFRLIMKPGDRIWL